MSNTTQWGQVVGAVVGYFTGGVGYVAFGAAVGGLAGSLLEPTQRTESGRINDLKVAVSQYGAGIPETWGNSVPPATWIWATDIIELGTTQSAGKGGGQEHTTHRQYIHGYLSLGVSPPPGSTVQIRKVWADGRLTFDGSTGLSVGQALANEENPFTRVGIYPGYEDQLPSAFIEFFEGIGNVPAYRGVIGLLITALECPGGRIPQISCEVCINAQVIQTNVLFDKTGPVDFSNSAVGLPFFPVRSGTESSLRVGAFKSNAKSLEARTWVYGLDGEFYTSEPRRPSDEFPVDLGGPYAVGMFRGYAVRSNRLVQLAVGALPYYGDAYAEDPAGYIDNVLPSSEYLCGAMVSVDGNRLMVFTSTTAPGTAASAVATKWYQFDNIGSVVRSGTIPTALAPNAIGFGHSEVNFTGVVGALAADYTSAWTSDSGAFRKYTINSANQFVPVGSSISAPSAVGDAFSVAITIIGDKCYLITGERIACIWPQTSVLPTEVPVEEIIESEIGKVGLSAQVDVSDVEDTVMGYTFNKTPASVRTTLSPLLTYSGLGLVEEDGLVRFFSRADRPVSGQVSYDDLASFEVGQEAGDPFPLTRAQEGECPRAVTVQYVNPTFDYQVSTETARRIVADTDLEDTVTLDVVMLPDRAATLAHRILYERWIARQTRSFRVPRKYAAMSAGDVWMFEYPRGTSSAWMLSKVTDTGALIEGECFPADAELLTQTVPGSAGFTGQQISELPSPTRLVVVDSAILRDADNNAGVYAVMGGYSDGWPGAELFAGDDPESLQSRGSVTNEAVAGFAESALGTYSLGNVDEHNVVVVNVGHHSLSSVTRDVLLVGSQNVAVIGAPGRWEVVKFQRADDLGGGRYRLSGWLRGLQGTEWAIGTHGAGDAFVLMSAAGTIRPNFDVGSLGQTKTYRAATLGRRLDSADLIYEVNTGEGLRPLSPTTLRKSFATNDIVLAWGRRTRLSQQWWLGTVPLGEESERYEIDIYSSNTFTTLRRTLSSASPTVTYTSADQVADFGSNQAMLHVRIYQMSGAVGRGRSLQQSI